MKWRSRSLWMASVCVAATGLFLNGPARAGEDPGSAERPAQDSGLWVDLGPTGSIRTPKPADLPRQAEQDGAWIQPELPPDVASEPDARLTPPAEAAARPSPESPRDAVSAIKKPEAEAMPPPVRSSGGAQSIASAVARASAPAATEISAWDVEAAVAAMATAKIPGNPVGAADWRSARWAIGFYYLLRGFTPLWTNETGWTPAARLALARLGRAGEDGLDLSLLALPTIGGDQLTPSRLAEADIRLSEAIVAYALQASGGRVDPGAISPQITDKPNIANPLKALGVVAAARDPGAALEEFNPPQKGYRDLRDKLAELRAERAPAATAIPAGPLLKIGMVDPRVALIRARFGLDAIGAEGAGALVYDAKVAAAVADFQRANGLAPSGLLTASTVDALSGGAMPRQEAAILANMEIWRWEPRDMGEERLEVNVPDFTLKVSQGDEVIHRARVIVGKPETQTAIFSNQIKYLLVNPAWNVPMSIIKKEMLPKLVKDPDYLVKAGFEVTQKGDTITVRQPPGERNALGHILFMFPNEHSIYLHDTPSRGLFASSRRAFSHGCVRVDDPMRLGELVMGGPEAGWTQARLRALVGDKERTIFLPRPLAIHIEYFTAFVDDSGELQMRDDIYGHMRRIERALGLPSEG